MTTRRDFLKKGGLLGLAGITLGLQSATDPSGTENILSTLGDQDEEIKLPKLEYGYDALEPFIDKKTMEIHHTKHHQAYIDKLNKAGANAFDRKADAAANCKKINGSTDPLVRNNMGGHYNHSLFWQLLKPVNQNAPAQPGEKLQSAINAQFQSLDNFKTTFTDTATKLFGSGWCWLIVDASGKLKISTTANQDNPLMSLDPQPGITNEKGTPVLALDVWEHAYYLNYQNKRADYIKAWWNVVNWGKAESLFLSASK